MTRSFRCIAVACAALALVSGMAGESLACFGWWGSSSPCGTTTYRPLFPFLTGYRGVAASPCCGTGSPCATGGCGTCSTCAPQVSTCNSCYRMAYAPVVAYRPAGGGCNSCGATTVLRPVVSYAPAYSAPVQSYAAPSYSAPVMSAPSSGCSNCGASLSNPSAPVVSRIVQPSGQAMTYSSPAILAPASNLPAANSYAQSSGSYSPPGGSYTSTAPLPRTPVIPRPGPVDDQPSLLDQDAGVNLPQRSIPDVRTSSPKSKVLTREETGADRTTRLPSHRTSIDRPIEQEPRTIIQTQHTQPAKKKIDDGGWRPLK